MLSKTVSYRARRRVGYAILAVGGVVLLVLSATWAGDEIEQFFRGEATGQLSWGPQLFRALLAFHGLLLLGSAIVASTRREPERQPTSPGAARHPRPPGSLGREKWLWLALVCGVGLLLRLWKLDSGLWIDEVFTLVDFVRPPLRESLTAFPSQNQHMLYSLLAQLSIGAFGESEVSLRLPAVALGVGSIWALFLLGSRTSGDREALLAAALMTVSYHHVWFSQNARGYTGLLLFTLLATWFWLRASSRGGLGSWAGYVATVCLGMWTHLTMLFVVAAHGIVYLAQLVLARGGQRRAEASGAGGWEPLVAWLVAGSLTLQLYALSLPEFLRTGLHEESLPSEWTDPLWLFREILLRLRDGGFVGVALIGGVALLTLGWLSLARRDWRTGLAIALPGLLGGATMIALGHNLWPRFFFFCMGFALLAVIRGLTLAPTLVPGVGSSTAPARMRLARAVGLAFIGLLIVGSAASLPRGYRLPKQDFAGARDYVERARSGEEEAVAVGLAGEMFRRFFAPTWKTPETRVALEGLQAEHSSVWLVYTLPIHLKAWYPEIWGLIQEEYEVVEVFPGTLGGGEVVVCRIRSGA